MLVEYCPGPSLSFMDEIHGYTFWNMCEPLEVPIKLWKLSVVSKRGVWFAKEITHLSACFT